MPEPKNGPVALICSGCGRSGGGYQVGECHGVGGIDGQPCPCSYISVLFVVDVSGKKCLARVVIADCWVVELVVALTTPDLGILIEKNELKG